jgi:hypothetical protein
MDTGPVTIFKTFSVIEAQVVCGRLEAAGFEAEVTHELAALSMEGYSMSTGGVRVVVPADQAAEARQYLDQSEPVVPGDTVPPQSSS